jgi:hypothetical protein
MVQQGLLVDRSLLSLRRNPLARAEPDEIAVNPGVENRAQRALIVVLKRDEAEWLQNSVLRFARRLQDLRHAFHRARFRLEGDLDQIALLQGSGQSQHAASLGNGLQFRARAASVVELDDDRDCAAKLNSLRPILRVSLGEVCHRQNHYAMAEEHTTDDGRTPMFRF